MPRKEVDGEMWVLIVYTVTYSLGIEIPTSLSVVQSA